MTPPPPTPRKKYLSGVASVTGIVFGAALIAAAARFSFTLPTGAVPQTGQTAAVLVIAMLGRWHGAVAIVCYIVAGLLGAPIFADGGAGWAHASGSSAGYLIGFVIAGGMLALAARRDRAAHFLYAFVLGLGAHAIIFLCGWLGLLRYLGPVDAYAQGVAPFGDGAVVKSLVAALLVSSLLRFTPPRHAHE